MKDCRSGSIHIRYLNINQDVDTSLEQFWIACGKSDFLFGRSQELDETLTALGIKHLLYVSDGGHSMDNRRQYLYRFAQLLFKE